MGKPVEGEIVGFLKSCQIKHSEHCGEACYVVREAGPESVVNDLREVPVASMHEEWLVKNEEAEDGDSNAYEPITEQWTE
jgi:hypothetical protein